MNPPTPWSSRLPWDDPAFSARMLKEHLTQDHGAASRTGPDIDAHVAWLHDGVMGGHPGRFLDLGCGPGLYTSRLATLGHTCIGIDFAPAAIDHARTEAQRLNLACEYRLEDLHTAGLGSGFDLITMLFGDLDTFPPDQATDLVRRAAAALAPGGRIVVESHARSAVEAVGTHPPTSASLETGLFHDGPHTLEEQRWWDAGEGIALHRFRVVRPDVPTAEYTITLQAREQDWYARIAATIGLNGPERYQAFGEVGDPNFDVFVLSAG